MIALNIKITFEEMNFWYTILLAGYKSPSTYWMLSTKTSARWHSVEGGLIDLDKQNTWWLWRIFVTLGSLTLTLRSVILRDPTQLSSNTHSCWGRHVKKCWAVVRISKLQLLFLLLTIERYVCIKMVSSVSNTYFHRGETCAS